MKKLKIISAIIILGIIVVITISYFTLPVLTITTTPKESEIFINDHFYSQSSYKARLKKGAYQIKVSKQDYLDYTEIINLNKNTNLNIILQPNKDIEVVKTPISHSLTSSISSTKNNILISIDRDKSQLIKTEDSKTTVIYSSPVKTFDYQYPIVALIKKAEPNSIVFINLETNEKRVVTPKETILASGVSISPSSSDTFILGNIDTINRTNSIYRIINGDENPTKITDTKATKIKALNEQYVVEFAYADYNNASVISVLDTLSGKRIFSEHGNHFSVSPDNKTIAVFHSEKIITFSHETKSLTEENISIPYSAKWLSSDEILIFANKLEGTVFSLFNTTTKKLTAFKKINSLGDTFIKSVDGITEKDIYLTSIDGKLYNIPRSIFETSP